MQNKECKIVCDGKSIATINPTEKDFSLECTPECKSSCKDLCKKGCC